MHTDPVTDLDRFYSLLTLLKNKCGGFRYLRLCDGKMAWPNRGLYFFFEPGEFRQDGSTLRVVRIGTHAVSKGSKATLWNRLLAHRGHSSGGGNHRASVFRLLVGSALIHKKHYSDTSIAAWGVGNSTSREIQEVEYQIEQDVSDYIGSMPFLWLEIDDPPGPGSLRSFIERNAIGLVSALNGGPDLPSSSWLGHSCPNRNIRESGLWNSQYIREKYNPEFLDVFEELIAGSREQHGPGFQMNAGNETDLIKRDKSMNGTEFPWIATVTLETNSYKFDNNDPVQNQQKNADRLKTLEKITRDLAGQFSGPGVILLPGGFFHSGTAKVETCVNSIQKAVSGFLNPLVKTHPGSIIVVIGIDGNVSLDEGETYRYDRDQVGIAVDNSGLVAFAKKFYPTDTVEAQCVDVAHHYLSRESVLGKEWNRMFTLAGKTFFIAVCNDIKGVSRFKKPERVDYILALIHGCYQRGDGPTGSYLVRIGFGNASYTWCSPVFGSVVFFNRGIPEKWRTGVQYRSWDRTPIQCSTDDNSLIPVFEKKVGSDHGEVYTIALFDLSDIPPGKPEIRNYPVKSGSGEGVKSKFTAAQINSKPVSQGSELFQMMVSKAKTVLSYPVLEQKTKITFRAPNIVRYPNRREIDLLSIYRAPDGSKKGVKFLLYHHVLGALLGVNVDKVYDLLPKDYSYGKLKENPGPAEQYITGIFKDETDIDRFMAGIEALTRKRG